MTAIDAVGFVVRWARFAAMLALLGAVTFRLIVLPRSGAAAPLRETATRRAARIGRSAAIVLVVSALGSLFVQTAEMRFPGDSWMGVARKMILETSWGTTWLVQVAAAGLSVVAFIRAREGRDARWIVAALLGIALTGTLTGSSHAMSAHRWPNITVLADFTHVIAASIWLGTLGVVFDSVRHATAGQKSDASYDAAIVRAFSPVALTAAASVAATGLIGSFAHIEQLNDLYRSRYGQALIAKVVSVVIVLVIGWRNWKKITPHMQRDGPVSMRRGMLLELVATTVVLVVTALLVVTPPPMDGMTMP